MSEKDKREARPDRGKVPQKGRKAPQKEEKDELEEGELEKVAGGVGALKTIASAQTDYNANTEPESLGNFNEIRFDDTSGSR